MSMATPLTALTALKPPSVLQLALRAFQRDFRAGELRLLLVAVALAVAALTAVAFFADRLNEGLARDARALLGGDAVLSTDRPAPPTVVALAQALGLKTATSASFPSMARAPDARGGASRLVSVKAVSAGYPLRGELQLQERPGAPAMPKAAAPEPGTVWVDGAVLTALQLNVGEPLLLGDATLKITHIIAGAGSRCGVFRLRPAGDAEPGGLGCHGPGAACQPCHLAARRGGARGKGVGLEPMA